MLITTLATQLLFAHPESATQDWVARDRTYHKFFIELQAAVRSGDRKAVANLSAIPLRVNLDRNRFALYRSKREIERDYYYIFTPKVRSAILRQRPEELWGRDQGVTLKLGEVWFDHQCLDGSCAQLGAVQIKAVNR